MTEAHMKADWRARAARRQRTYWLTWVGSPLLFLAGMMMAGGGLIGDDRPLLVIGAVIALAGFLWSTVIYMRVIDEQERDATLWGTFAGMSVYFALFVARTLPVMMHRPAPFGDHVEFIVSMIVVLAVFCWKRFR